MSQVNTVDLIDGNQYLVNSASNTSETKSSQDVSFDNVYNSQTKSLEDIFQNVSAEYGVPVKLLKAVAQAESSFDTNAVSGCGASGIMQLMPETAKSLGVEDVLDAQQNITGGAKMLAYLLDDYGGNTTLALAAYNAGSGAVAKYGGVPPYAETQNYINKINGILGGALEADTTNISIEKKSGVTSSSAALDPTSNTTSNTTLNTKITPVKIINTQSLATEAFSYERYLKFLELYESLNSKTDDSKVEEQVNYRSKQQSLYELQQAKFNSRAHALLDL